MVYENKCGPFTLEVSSPYPMWVTITHQEWSEATEIRGVRIEQLRDLRHLIDRALAAAEARERHNADGAIQI